MLMQDGGLVSGAGANDWIGTSSPPPQAARSKAVVAAHHKLIKGSKLRRQPQKARMLRQLSLTNSMESMESSPSITFIKKAGTSKPQAARLGDLVALAVKGYTVAPEQTCQISFALSQWGLRLPSLNLVEEPAKEPATRAAQRSSRAAGAFPFFLPAHTADLKLLI